MSAHDYYSGRAVAPQRKTWWDWLFGGPSDAEQRVEAIEAAARAQNESFQEALEESEHYQRMVADLEELERQLTDADDAGERSKIRDQIAQLKRGMGAFESALRGIMASGGRSAG